MKHELRALTSVRGIAAWFVVLYHIRMSIDGLPGWALAIVSKGYLAVDFFFLLSGFVIWLAWGQRLRDDPRQVPAFLKKRIARVWPLHLGMLGFGVAFAGALSLRGPVDPDYYPFALLPLHVLLIQNWGFAPGPNWNVPAWSISTEWAAYLLFPILAFTIDWRRMPRWAAGGAILALFVLLDAAMTMAGATNLGFEIDHFGLLRCLVEFTAGGALCGIWMHGGSSFPAFAVASAVALGWWAGLPEMLAVPALFAALLLALALSSGGPHHPLEGRSLHWLGEISYATYLSHFLLWVVFKLVAVDDPRHVSHMLIATYLIGVLAASALLYRYIERPAQRWILGLRLPRPQPLGESH